ncbi:wall-associated receptor kinase-like 14 [Coffea arabica]|uniref:Wall-associated receptor kinase-like 14 n=1 Tax=Coffea arabica TaxID=13443 RepID=A0A6P6USV0_COFAR|nr:wall-associated receptor kinase-like 14 [Coffea arabica]
MVIPFLSIISYVLYRLSSLGNASAICQKSCGAVSYNHIPFPFGFSSGCQIQLNCTSNGTMVIHDFPILDISQESIMVNLQAQCGRSMSAIDDLFGPNYAPTSHNGILMENCTAPVPTCVIPTTMVLTHFELLDCGAQNSSNLSCYSEPSKQSLFMNYNSLVKNRCSSLFSAISIESYGTNSSSVSLTVQLVQLGWWLQGHCHCSIHANCTKIWSPTDEKPGYRCQCLDGYVGDGYIAGVGCRRDSTRCNPAKYLSGQCGGTTRVGVLVGGVIAGAALMVSIGLVCCFVRRRSRLKTRNKTKRELCKATGITIPVYHYKEVEKATESFSEKRRLGTGAYGTVYSGKLHNDEWVAIKRIRHRDTESTEQVLNEIKLISTVSHPNLVRLLGCSIEKGEQILVYEFMPNGTLSQHLQREKGNGLPWAVRITIAAETAQAIAYLHNAVHPPIYHRDIKSSNILLDYNYKSKVADFGLSRLGMVESSHISTAPQGTPGYLDPQYHQHFHLSDKSDVYSFGVVLLEIITGLKAVDFNRPQHEINLANLAVDRIGKGCLHEIIDPFLEPHKDPWTISSTHKVAELAFRCLAFHRDMRPSMMEVAIELEQIRLSKWANSEENTTGLPASAEVSSCSSSSSACEKPLNLTVQRAEITRTIVSVTGKLNSMERDYSPVSVQHPWPSEQSSPSSNSLLSHVIP